MYSLVRSFGESGLRLEGSKGGMKVGRIKDPLHKGTSFGTTPPTFITPLEPFDFLKHTLRFVPFHSPIQYITFHYSVMHCTAFFALHCSVIELQVWISTCMDICMLVCR